MTSFANVSSASQQSPIEESKSRQICRPRRNGSSEGPSSADVETSTSGHSDALTTPTAKKLTKAPTAKDLFSAGVKAAFGVRQIKALIKESDGYIREEAKKGLRFGEVPGSEASRDSCISNDISSFNIWAGDEEKDESSYGSNRLFRMLKTYHGYMEATKLSL